MRGSPVGQQQDQTLRQQLEGEPKLYPDPDHPSRAEEAAAALFQDYVVLQFASSRLRTELGRDVRGRRPLFAESGS